MEKILGHIVPRRTQKMLLVREDIGPCMLQECAICRIGVILHIGVKIFVEEGLQ